MLILDCDPGLDDALAILMALGIEGLAPRALTTVGGNVPLADTTRNALGLLALGGRDDIPVYPGCPNPLMARLVTAAHVHGTDGVGGMALPVPRRRPQRAHAVDFVVAASRAAPPGGVTLCVTGPMTNIALALVKAPDIAGRIARIVFMGGAAQTHGNVTPAAEYNFHVDPHAARVVLAAGVPLVMLGLDVTHKVRADRARIEAIRAIGGPASTAVAGMLDRYARNTRFFGREGCALHDPCTIAYLADPALFSGVERFVSVDTNEGPNLGRSICDWRGVSDEPANATVITDVDADGFFALMTDALARLDARLSARPGA